MPDPRLDKAFRRRLEKAAGAENLTFDYAECLVYGYDNSRRQAQPDAVVWGKSRDQVAAVVRACHDTGVPLITRGLGSNTTGATVPVDGGVVLSLERMDRVLEVNADDRYAVVEPGVTNADLQESLAEYGFFWPPDPTSAPYATVGGNLACNAAGPRAVKYGTPRENTLGLEAVTGTGAVLETGVFTTKGVVGYDLTRLLIGSEGTLGVITRATLRITPLPAAKRTLRAVYRDVGSAARAVSRIMGQAAVPCALEFMDGAAISLVRDTVGSSLPDGAGALLLIEADGTEAGVEDAAASIAGAARVEGLLALDTARTAGEIRTLWAARKALSPSLRKAAAGKINEDVVVPVSRIPDLVAGLGELAGRHELLIVNFGHAGNGNLHVNLLFDPEDEQQSTAAEACLEDVFDLVIRLDGTLSGEHGVGLVKRDFIDREVGEVALGIMRGVKQVFDPKGILNPGKLLPPE